MLTINQVFQILVNYSQESNWEKAFLDVIPKRKGIEPIENSIEEDLPGNDADEQSPTVGATLSESIEFLTNDDDTDANIKTNE